MCHGQNTPLRPDFKLCPVFKHVDEIFFIEVATLFSLSNTHYSPMPVLSPSIKKKKLRTHSGIKFTPFFKNYYSSYQLK